MMEIFADPPLLHFFLRSLLGVGAQRSGEQRRGKPV